MVPSWAPPVDSGRLHDRRSFGEIMDLAGGWQFSNSSQMPRIQPSPASWLSASPGRSSRRTKIVVLTVLSSDWQPGQHLGTCWKGRSVGPTPGFPETLGWGPAALCIHKPSRGFGCMVTCGNHCSRSESLEQRLPGTGERVEGAAASPPPQTHWTRIPESVVH